MTRLLFAFVSVSGLLAADPLSDVLARMDKSAKSFVSMKADLKNDDYAAPVDEHEIHAGTVKFSRPKGKEARVLIEFTGKNAESVSLDAKQAKVFNPKTSEVQVYDITTKRGLIVQYLLLGFGAPSSEITAQYTVTWVGEETIGGQATGHIKLVPKSAEVLRNLKQADLWISDTSGLPVQQKFITSGVGDYKLATYSNVKINPSLSDKDLKLSLPKGVTEKKVG